MKSIKIFFLATVAIVAGLFTACSDDDFKAGPEVDGAQVYFPENVTTQHSISDDVSSIAIPVKRIAKDEALTVAVLASDESGLFTIPSSVSFAAGKETSELLITFDRTKLEDGKEYPLSFLINDEDNTTPYGNRSLDITGYALAVGENGNRQIPRRLVERCIHRQYVRNRCHGTQP